MQAANRVAFNTGALYAKMVLTMGLSLYSTRIILNALGAEDFGTFNLLGGIIGLFSLLSFSFSASILRYLSYHIGAGNKEMVKTIFFASCYIHLIVAILIAIILYLIGFFLFNGNFLNISPDRIDVAKIIYYYAIFASFISILIPSFGAMITAKEDIIWIAIIYTLESLLKFGIAIYITYTSFDKLETYGFLMGIQPVFSLLFLWFVCYKKYDECRSFSSNKKIEKKIFKDMSFFIGWSLFGNAAKVIKDQGLALVFNVFFGTIINAAYGIANQITNQLNFFSATAQGTTSPQITKSEGAGNRERTIRLSIFSSKLGFFLLAIIAIPTIFELKPLLTLWLKNVPDYTVIFCTLILISKVIEQLTSGLNTTFLAFGNIKYYQIVTGTLTILNLPFAYFLLSRGFSAYTVLYFCLFIEIIIGISRLFFLRLLGGVHISNSIKELIGKEFLMMIPALILCSIIFYFIEESLFRIVFMYSISSISFILCFYFLSINTDERKIITNILSSLKEKIIRKKIS